MSAVRAGDRFALECHVDDVVYETFRDVFLDRNPLHTDPEFAIAQGFSGIVMHGNILGGFLSRLVGEVLPTRRVILQSQTINFRRPVYLGDHLELNAVVTDVFDSVSAAELSFEFTNSDAAKVASGTILIGLLP